MGKQVEADVADVGHVVDPAMMLPLVSERENSEHVHHASHFLLYRNYLEEIVLDVYVPLKYSRSFSPLVLAYSFKQVPRSQSPHVTNTKLSSLSFGKDLSQMSN